MRNYWYVSPSRDGWQNLAMDEWFLDHLNPNDLILYFYVNQNIKTAFDENGIEMTYPHLNVHLDK